MAGAHWIVDEWLSELTTAGSFDHFGWSGLVVLTAGCYALSITLLARWPINRGEATSSLVLTVASAILLLPDLLPAPYILALPVMVAWSGALVAARDAKRAPPFIILPLMTLWVNLHGTFMVGLGLALFLSMEAVVEGGPNRRLELRRWGAFTCLATLAAMLDPNGVANFVLPFRIMGMTVLKNHFIEWMSLNFHIFQPLEIWLLGLIFVGYSFRLKLPPLRLLFILVLVHFSLVARRHTELLAVLGPIVAWGSLGPQIEALMMGGGCTQLSRIFSTLAARTGWPARMMAALVIGAIGISRLFCPIELPNSYVRPASALAAAARMGLSGHVFNSEVFGGYLIFKGIPTFIDARAAFFGSSFLARYLKASRGDGPVLRNILKRYHVTWTLLAPQSGAALVLKRLPGWEQVYNGPYAVIDRPVPASGTNVGKPRTSVTPALLRRTLAVTPQRARPSCFCTNRKLCDRGRVARP